MTQKERMLAGLPYKAWMDGLPEERKAAKEILYRFNHTPPREQEASMELLKGLFARTGKALWWRPPSAVTTGTTSRWGRIFTPTTT